MVRKLDVAALIETCGPAPPAHMLSCGRGVEALLLAILDGHHALYKVGTRLEERGMLPLLQPGRTRTTLHDDRLGQILDTVFAANLNQVFGAVALRALEVYAIPPCRSRISVTLENFCLRDDLFTLLVARNDDEDPRLQAAS